VPLLVCFTIGFVFLFTNQNQLKVDKMFKYQGIYQDKTAQKIIEPTKIAISCCGEDVIKQTLVLIKSSLIFTKSYLHFIIISDVTDKIQDSVIYLSWKNNMWKIFI